jgi:type IV secretory pathway TrbL component
VPPALRGHHGESTPTPGSDSENQPRWASGLEQRRWKKKTKKQPVAKKRDAESKKADAQNAKAVPLLE